MKKMKDGVRPENRGWISEQDGDISLAEELNQRDRTLEAGSRREPHGSLPWEHGPSREPRPEELLAEAVVLQAAEDWRWAVGRLRRQPGDPTPARVKRETERFFQSRWFRQLTDLEGEAVLKHLKEED